jgi:hypothetical protein
MSNKIIILFAFFEGFTVMLVELLGGKMLAPYFGNSLIIWTSTIGITMTCLMIGYFIGGRLSSFEKKEPIIYVLLTICSIWILKMPDIVNSIIQRLNDYDIYRTSILSTSLLFTLPLVILGICPPILISMFTSKKNAGYSSAMVFAFSTIGSIVSALIIGFLIIEDFGISKPIMIYSLFFFLLNTFVFWDAFRDKLYYLLFSIPIALITFSSFKKQEQHNYLFISESLQGQLKVVDEPGNRIGNPRYLQINGVNQTRTIMDFNNPIMNQSGWFYVHLDGAIASHKPIGSNALLMGFGGGSIALELVKLDFNVDVVEIDERLPSIAHDYFLFDTSRVDFHIDDARHFIKKQKNKVKYDIVVIDLLHGEVQPNHIFTLEGLNELKHILKKDATIIVNYQSNYDEPQKPYLAILNTFWAANYDAIIAKTKDDRPADYIYIASPTIIPKNIFDDNHMNDCCFNNSQVKHFKENPTYITKDSDMIKNNPSLVVLTDNNPILETMNKESIVTWRKHMINHANKINTTLFK